jgi:uncharacterized protein YdhG (YjbR/CyaY superfamily)
MQYEAKTPKEYITNLENDWRKEKVEELRKLIKSSAPEIEESINYKMLCYRGKEGIIFHLNAQKNYVSLYVGDTNKIDPDGELLMGIDVGKGCIRFRKTTSLTDTRVSEFIEKTIQFWREGKDIYC